MNNLKAIRNIKNLRFTIYDLRFTIYDLRFKDKKELINPSTPQPFNQFFNRLTFLFFTFLFSFFTFSINAQSTISGFFTYDNTASTPLDSVWIFLTQNGVKLDSVQSNINGFYLFNNVLNGAYNITATTTKPWSHVNITDAIVVKNHFGGNTLLTSSLKLHAADVNSSIFINVTDGVQICKRFAGSLTSFQRGDWVFEKPFGGDTISVSQNLNDTVIVNGANVNQNFKGRCVGDVN